jgi:hypothetical protein
LQRSYYIIEKPECNLIINKLPIWFKEVEFDGDEISGKMTFHSHKDYDENWGPEAKIEISWEKKDRITFYHPREVQESINAYNAINVVVSNKENIWIRSHEFTIWYGSRTKMIKKKYYVENSIHGIFYCDLTERLITLHAIIIKVHYDEFKQYILECFKSIICH